MCAVLKVCVPESGVYIFAAHCAKQLRPQKQLFGGVVGGHQRTNGLGTSFVGDVFQGIGHKTQSGVPVHLVPYAGLLDHGSGEPVV